MELKEKFEELASEYVKTFCTKHDFSDDVLSEMYWIGNKVGGILLLNDYHINYNDIRLDIDKQIDKEVFWKWYDYSLAVSDASAGAVNCTYEEYLAGKRPYTSEQMEYLQLLQKNVEQARSILETEIKNMQKNNFSNESSTPPEKYSTSEIEFLIEEQKRNGGGSFTYDGTVYNVNSEGQITHKFTMSRK